MELTEAETEYKVTCIKHVFKDNVVFQFKCTNTIEEQVLEDVSVVMEVIEGDHVFEEIVTIPLASMPLGKPGSTYVSFARADGEYAAAKFACILKFTSKEVDPSTGGVGVQAGLLVFDPTLTREKGFCFRIVL